MVKIRAHISIIMLNLNEDSNKRYYLEAWTPSLQCAIDFFIKACLPTVEVIQFTPKIISSACKSHLFAFFT